MASLPLGDVIEFPRPERPEPKPNEATEEEIARFVKLVKDGYTEEMAIEIVALSRRVRGF